MPGRSFHFALASSAPGIVKQSGGHILVESQPGMGAIFQIYLPRAPQNGTPEPEAPARSEAAGASGTILLVEDEPDVRRTVRQMLLRQGYGVLEADGGASAVEICRTHPGQIDLLLTDVVMQEQRGPELACDLSALRPGLKVLYMSGYAADAIGQSGVLGPEMMFLPKPFTSQALAARIREVLSQG